MQCYSSNSQNHVLNQTWQHMQ